MSTELNLYGIEQTYLRIASDLLDNGGELTPELEQALELNKENLEVKSAKYAYIVKKYDDEVSLIDNEIKRLTELKNAREKAQEKLKERVKNAMILFGYTEIQSQNIKLSFRKSTALVITDEKAIPAKYKKKVSVVKIDNAAIKNDINAGKKVKGAHVDTKQNLQIR